MVKEIKQFIFKLQEGTEKFNSILRNKHNETTRILIEKGILKDSELYA